MAQMTVLCEYTKNPIGLNSPKPRFSWKLESGADQKNYTITVGSWKKSVQSAETLVTYEGEPLKSCTVYPYSVSVTLQDGTAASASGFFETAYMCAEDWQGGYITYPNYEKRKAPMFLKQFSVCDIAEARIYIIGLGYYQLSVNGTQVGGNTVLNPGWTDYNLRVLYDTYDVTALLRDGKNAIGVMLGEGWLGHEHPFFDSVFGHNPSWFNQPCLKLDLRLTMKDGSVKTISADESWLSAQSPIIMNNIYDGETYDATLEIPGWDTPDFQPDERFINAVTASNPPRGIPDTTLMPRITEFPSMAPVEVHRPGQMTLTYDFGLNIAGWTELRLRGRRGLKVTVRYGESMKADKTVNQMNLRMAKSTDTYILKGEGEERFKPHFTYHGFRFAEVTIENGVVLMGCSAFRVHNALSRSGNFECSDEMLNKIYTAIINTEMNNEHSVPTDCPQRDERLAWINDMTVRWEQMLFNFDCRLFFEKWLNDIMDSQTLTDNGAIGDTAPFYYGGYPASHVSSIYTLLPYYMYLFYNDITPLARCYDGMSRYVRFKLGLRDANGLIPEGFFGDWAPPINESEFGHSCDALPVNIGKQIITTGYLHYDCKVMAQAARATGHQDDIAFFEKEAERTAESLNAHCLKDTYLPNSQGSNVFPLFLDIVPEDKKDSVTKALLDDLTVRNNCHITTGNQTTKYLFEVLNKLDRNDIAVQILQKKDYPSFGYMFAQGGTTIWERFENSTGVGMNSHNHPMHGSFCVWYFKALAGINPTDLTRDGFFTVKPDFACGLDRVSASCETPTGTLASEWKKCGEGYEMMVTVPWNTKAKLQLPEGCLATAVELTSGKNVIHISKA